jgi:uncharacterized protein YgiM (DUF1202 family)
MAVLATCAVAAFIFYPSIEPVVVKSWWPKIVGFAGEVTDEVKPLLRRVGAEIWSRLPDSSPAGETRTVIDVPIANVRAGPSTASPVVLSVSRYTEVTPVERRGNWVLIRIGGEGGQQGWVHNSLLNEAVPQK